MLSIFLVAALVGSHPAAPADRDGIDGPFAIEAQRAPPAAGPGEARGDDLAEPAEELICRSRPRPGSRIAGTEICRTVDQWRRYHAEFGMTWGSRSAAGSRPGSFERAVPGLLVGGR